MAWLSTQGTTIIRTETSKTNPGGKPGFVILGK
ncbi:hypothetical protein SAMN06265219_1117 [Gracilimonas mengyeensis]|uniref:Uncharacterized protein n=1 Tax=Gracilimonas mengyeensis TaxID=1302730 RepID=A0A521E7Y8_9BACT|nr:hypothetical protein SAMN06265219_1117 [Gracilimonas mengyeensis]